MLAFSVLGVGWLLLTDRRVRSTVTGRILLVEALIAGLVLPIAVIDATRICGTVLAAATLAWVAHAPLADGVGGRLWRRNRLIATILPIPLVWAGHLLYPGWATGDVIQRALDGQVIR